MLYPIDSYRTQAIIFPVSAIRSRYNITKSFSIIQIFHYNKEISIYLNVWVFVISKYTAYFQTTYDKNRTHLQRAPAKYVVPFHRSLIHRNYRSNTRRYSIAREFCSPKCRTREILRRNCSRRTRHAICPRADKASCI